MIEVASYGIHRDPDGIAWLLQKKSSVNAIGLREPCPFEVKAPHGQATDLHCNHQVSLDYSDVTPAQIKGMKQIWNLDLFKIMAPVPRPRTRVFFIPDYMVTDVGYLAQMTSPIKPVVKPVWAAGDEKHLFAAMQSTNLQPLVITDISVNDLPLIRSIIPHVWTLPRQLIISSRDPNFVIPYGVEEVKKGAPVDPKLPWKKLGNEYVRAYMRGESL